MRIFAQRGFAADNAVLFLMSADVRAAVLLRQRLRAGVARLQRRARRACSCSCFFAGFATAAQWGGRILDARGAKPAVVLGCAVAAVGFYLWGASCPTELRQPVVLPRARRRRHRPRARTGQHRRRQPRAAHELRRGHRHHADGPQLRREPRPGDHGLDLPDRRTTSRIEDTLTARGMPAPRADAHRALDDLRRRGETDSSSPTWARRASAIFQAVQHDVAESTQLDRVHHGRHHGRGVRRRETLDAPPAAWPTRWRRARRRRSRRRPGRPSPRGRASAPASPAPQPAQAVADHARAVAGERAQRRVAHQHPHRQPQGRRVRLLRRAGVERRLRVVLDAELDRLRELARRARAPSARAPCRSRPRRRRR